MPPPLVKELNVGAFPVNIKSFAEVLTLSAGGAFPALFADAGECVSSSHARPTVGTRTGGTSAVFGCRKWEEGKKITAIHASINRFHWKSENLLKTGRKKNTREDSGNYKLPENSGASKYMKRFISK